METEEHIAALRREGELLAAAAERAGLAAAVPSCPPWQVRDLLRHTGHVHRWAAGYITGDGSGDRDQSEQEILAGGPPDDELVGWFRAGHAAVADALAAADPQRQGWAPAPGPSARAAWARRQAHETAIHRVDAELAAGAVTPFGPDFAADGIDELIIALYGRDPETLSAAERDGPRQALQVLTDGGWAWLIELTADGSKAARVTRGTGPASCTLAGPPSALYQLLWNRPGPATRDATVTGDAAILTAWREGMRVTWA